MEREVVLGLEEFAACVLQAAMCLYDSGMPEGRKASPGSQTGPCSLAVSVKTRAAVLELLALPTQGRLVTATVSWYLPS